MPNTNPIFWNELRHRLRGAHWFAILVTYLLALSGLIILIALALPKTLQTEYRSQFGLLLLGWLGLGLQAIITFISPALTVGIVSSEYEKGRLEEVLRTLVSPSSFVIGKYMGAYLLIIMLLLSSLPAFAIVIIIWGVHLNIILTDVVVSLIRTLIFAAFYSAIGLTSSCLFKSTAKAIAIAYGSISFLMVAKVIYILYWITPTQQIIQISPDTTITISPVLVAIQMLFWIDPLMFGVLSFSILAMLKMGQSLNVLISDIIVYVGTVFASAMLLNVCQHRIAKLFR